MSLKMRPICLWVSLFSCSFILSTLNRSTASVSSTSQVSSAGPQLAQFNIRLPGIPKVPGVPSVGDVLKDAIANQAVQALGSTLKTEAPIVSSAQDLFPTVATLPGSPFRPSGDLKPLWQQIRNSKNGSVLLTPGDYRIPISVFCMKHNASSPSGHRYLLAPLKGKLADVITALNSRTVGLNLPHSQLQVLSWNLQAGMKYEELTPELRAIVDQVLPDFKPRFSRSFLEQIEATWSQLSSTIPGLPSLDASLNRLGEVGNTVVMLKQTRETLLRYGNNYESISRRLVSRDAKATSGDTPWSLLSDRVYARMVTQGNYSTPAELQVRVVPVVSGAANPVQVSSSQGLIGSRLSATTVPVNLTNLVAEPQNSSIQPLSMSPQQDKKEDEDDSGSGTIELKGEGFTGPQSPPQGLPQS
jgi:hypothetical protein